MEGNMENLELKVEKKVEGEFDSLVESKKVNINNPEKIRLSMTWI